MDSEDEGELYVGCAGGTNANMQFAFNQTAVPSGMTAFKLSVTGLKGGHSGVDIPLGRGNSNKLMFRYIFHAEKEHGLRLANIDGGSLRNAIPRETFATVVVPNAKAEDMLKCVTKYEAIFKAELLETEPDLSFKAEKTSLPSFLVDEKTQKNLTYAVYGAPNAVIRMSSSMRNLVETSTNLAIIKSDDKVIDVLALLRSSVDSAKQDLENMFETVFTLAGAKVWFDGQYPGWKPNMSSAILKTMSEIYNNRFGKIPEIRAIHAGLECGLLGGVYPNWDMISFGPTIRFPHSPDEKVEIESVNKFWIFLVETLKNIPVK
jgi:dipeptidase D